jgi:predicted SAM-dependent methyltransferase
VIKTRFFFNRNDANRLEIGIGTSRKPPGVISSDINIRTDYPFDLRLGLPFPDSSIDFIYAEHVLEHFCYNDLVNLLKDCHRVLKPDGVLSVVVPDASLYINGYNNPDSFDRKEYCLYDFGLRFKSKIDFVNYIFYMDGQHRHMFDRESILSVLSEGGFNQVRLRGYDSSLDKETRRYESIYAESVKSIS